MSLLLLFPQTGTSDYALVGTGTQLTLSGGTASFAVSFSATGAALALSGGTTAFNLSLAGTGSALALSGGAATFVLSLPATGSQLTLSGGTAAFALGYTLVGTGSALTLSGGTASFALSLSASGSQLTFVGGTASFIVPVAETARVGGDDAYHHPGWNKKRATLKRDRDREFTEQIRDIYRTLIGDPRTAERAEEIVSAVTEPVRVKGESESAHEAALMARAEALRKRADAMDEPALQAEIALRFLHQELREIQEAEDLDVLNMLLPMMLGLREQPVDEARQQIVRELWDDDYDAEAIEFLLAQVL